jgi:putative nucleotidyltransferase with HDIG domain
MFSEVRLGKAIQMENCLQLVEDISDSLMRNPAALISLARLKTSDDYTYMHSVAVCALMVALGRTLGLDSAACKEAGLAGLLHDLGKALVPLEILNKPGALSDAEYAIVKQHAVLGYELLRKDPTIPFAAGEVSLHHHEKMDGSGYPDCLRGKKISLLSRMAAVCDVYDAITYNRPYKQGWDPAESLARMASWRGHFDASIFAAFVKSLGIYPTGALVRLKSGRLAVVIEQDPACLTKPVVNVFFCETSNMPVGPERLALAKAGVQDSIVGRASRKHFQSSDIDELWSDIKLKIG